MTPKSAFSARSKPDLHDIGRYSESIGAEEHIVDAPPDMRSYRNNDTNLGFPKRAE